MITAFKRKVKVKNGGLVSLRSSKLKPGTTAEVIVRVESSEEKLAKKQITAADLLASGLAGMWADRNDIGDSLEFARDIRKKAESRGK